MACLESEGHIELGNGSSTLKVSDHKLSSPVVQIENAMQFSMEY
jgi:hypothetical protein